MMSDFLYFYIVRTKEILTLKSTLNFFKLSICFLWSGAMEGPLSKERDVIDGFSHYQMDSDAEIITTNYYYSS